ncbi:hypothetical protein M413DRAFT_445989 [Hebeloma cylindrosporum]|uniref:Arrestin-like N-terminal domain-containing protein n=1 Tax=Hebeloma cylindrosporum TaxID=76867 RepID=A0A0C3BV89_HEBCY|nr:hypothetical protein M413DRAFT_445989 [Hebeloma cylindrosporum h7]
MSTANAPSEHPPTLPGMAIYDTGNPGTHSANAHELPNYLSNGRRGTASRPSGRSEPKEFDTKVEKKGRAIVTMTLVSEAAYSRTRPTFFEGTPVKGRVRLSLDQPDTIHSVVISVQGRFMTGINPEEQLTFIEISRTLWTQSDGAPKNARASDISYSQGGGKFTGKLKGEYIWPFSIDLPKEVMLPSGIGSNKVEAFPPPQTFNERKTLASINYEIYVRVARGRWKADHRMMSQFGYIPLTRPPPFPPLRLLAYQEGRALIDPTIDLEGWHSSRPARVHGTLFKDRVATILCTLFIAKPLSYTRGSLIPLCLRLEGDDPQALDILSSPKSILVRLRRHVRYQFPGKTGASEDTIEDSSPALWWPRVAGTEEISPTSEHMRYVNGELHLKVDLKPSSAMSHFRVEYSVVLFPFEAPEFEHSTEQAQPPGEAIIEQAVQIVTSFAPGPRPVKSAPGYDLSMQVHTAKPISAKNALV